MFRITEVFMRLLRLGILNGVSLVLWAFCSPYGFTNSQMLNCHEYFNLNQNEFYLMLIFLWKKLWKFINGNAWNYVVSTRQLIIFEKDSNFDPHLNHICLPEFWIGYFCYFSLSLLSGSWFFSSPFLYFLYILMDQFWFAQIHLFSSRPSESS